MSHFIHTLDSKQYLQVVPVLPDCDAAFIELSNFLLMDGLFLLHSIVYFLLFIFSGFLLQMSFSGSSAARTLSLESAICPLRQLFLLSYSLYAHDADASESESEYLSLESLFP
jgi:hypothetical protein